MTAAQASRTSAELVSVVLPVHNQAADIGAIVRDYVVALRRAPVDHELILVCNACSDDSEAVCAALAEEHGQVRTVATEKGGWGRAVRAGLREARGDLLCYTNSARTTPDILTLLVVYAAIYPGIALKANRRIRDSRLRRVGSILYNLECRLLFDLSVWDVNGTPKVFPRSFDRLTRLEQGGDLIDLEWAAACRREGYPLIEVPVLATPRRGGRSTTGLRSAVRMYAGALALRRQLGEMPPERPAIPEGIV